MPKYDGANIYNDTLTKYEDLYCQYRINDNMPQVEAYKKAYFNVNTENMPHETIRTRCVKIEKRDKVIKRINELRELKKVQDFNGNQTQAEAFEIFENNPKRNMFYLLYNFMNDCKTELKRSEQFKAIEAIAKLFNLYNDGQITNNQLNQIVINAPDVNSAINSIHALVNKEQIKQIQAK